jgi:hypothetical protein
VAAVIARCVPFDAHNVMQLNSDELACLEGLINQFMTSERAYGHPLFRIISYSPIWRYDRNLCATVCATQIGRVHHFLNDIARRA